MSAARHNLDLIMCRKQTGIAPGRLCASCDGKCPICDSYVRPYTPVRICDECAYGSSSTSGALSSGVSRTMTSSGQNFLSSSARGASNIGGGAAVGSGIVISGRCLICNGPGISDAFYCKSCSRLEKDREGCPKIVNVSAAVKDMFYERKKFVTGSGGA